MRAPHDGGSACVPHHGGATAAAGVGQIARRNSEAVQYGQVTSWLELSRVHRDPTLTPEQLAFVTEVRELLDGAGTPGLDREQSEAFNVAELFDGALIIRVRLP